MNRVAVSAEEVPLPAWAGRVKSFAKTVLARLDRDRLEISILLCDDRVIADLNSRYRGKEGPTDVLSFADSGGFPRAGRSAYAYAGDIAISLDTLRENARLFGIARDEELRRLLIHGILHLDGMDHHTNDKAEPMLRLQEQILEELSDLRILPAGLPIGGIA